MLYLLTEIFVSTNIVGDAAWIEKGGNYEIILAGKPVSNVNDVVVSLVSATIF